MEVESSSSPSTFLGFQIIPISIISTLIAALLALLFFTDYFRKKKSELKTIAKPETTTTNTKSKKSSHSVSKKPHSKASEKDQVKKHHHLDANTLKGHGDSVTAVCFSSDGCNLATEKCIFMSLVIVHGVSEVVPIIPYDSFYNS
ncbi:hypothetical protein GIB67_042146 [Kingdonia uniflora]|uniref:Uncharacterized protein n=1 Tax=Kingdonia uniflora TaxID=39325 RepID=A0A7J7NNT6_9MAGN|nr:hypothetical protein GIB67_042146 [Kingdonia uniflora]